MTNTTGIPEVSTWKYLRRARGILHNPLPFHREMFEAKGDTFKLKLGFGRDIIFSRDADFAQYVLQTNQRNYKKSEIQTKEMAKYLGQGLLTAEGELWKKQRKLIQPAFYKKQLILLLGTVHQTVKDELSRITPGKVTDIFPVFNDLAFQTVVRALFSQAANKEQVARLQFITEAAQKMLVKELRQPYLSWWFRYNKSIDRHLAMTGDARSILNGIIEERKASGNNFGDLLDMLLESTYEDGTHMTTEQLIDEILIIFTAGHETTSNALSFTVQLLANHPEEQEKVHKEVTEAFESSDQPMEILNQCGYTQKVIEESMRLYPPAYFIDRVNLQKDSFEDKFYAPGSNLLFSVYEMHRHANYWEDPEVFNPGRFDKPISRGYFPFGAGPRKCIGSNFAMFEMVLCIAELVSRYNITKPSPQIEIFPLITLKPKNAHLIFEER